MKHHKVWKWMDQQLSAIVKYYQMFLLSVFIFRLKSVKFLLPVQNISLTSEIAQIHGRVIAVSICPIWVPSAILCLTRGVFSQLQRFLEPIMHQYTKCLYNRTMRTATELLMIRPFSGDNFVAQSSQSWRAIHIKFQKKIGQSLAPQCTC